MAEQVTNKVRVFPTHVGMNRWEVEWLDDCLRIPHTRGDEPQ